MKKLFCCGVLIMCILSVGCTENTKTRTFGGTQTLNIPKGQKLVNATWKEADLWYLTRPMRDGEVPERLTFQESSNFGVMEGTVIFVESR